MISDTDAYLNEPLDLPGGETGDKRSPHKKSRRRRGNKKVIIVAIIIIIAAVIGYVSLRTKPSDSQKDTNNTASKNESSKNSASSDDIPSTSTSKKFESGVLGLELSYPSTWTVTETSDRGLRVESPEFAYPTTDQAKITGYFRIYIRKSARSSDSKYIGRGVAIQPSEIVVYSQPSSTQRKETNMSLFGLDTADHFAFFLLAGNFQLNKGDTLGPNYGKEIESYIIGGGYSSKTLTDDLATNKVPIDGLTQKNSYKQAIEIIKSLKID